MDAQQFMQVRDKFSQTVSIHIGNRTDNVLDTLKERCRNVGEWKEELQRMNADKTTITFFVEEDGADEQVKSALEFLAQKLEFKGDVVASRKPASNGKNYYFVQSEPREPVFGEGFFDAE